MIPLLETLLTAIGALLKVAFIPVVILMLISVVAKPAMRFLPMREEVREPLLGFFRIVGVISTALVLLAFVFLFAGLWLASRQASTPV